MKCSRLFIFTAILAFAFAHAKEQTPEQIHLALGSNPTEFAISWVTQDPNNDGPKTHSSVVLYGKDKGSLTEKAVGDQKVFTDGGASKRKIITHTVRLSGLTPGTKYYYKCGDLSAGMSEVYSFSTLPADRTVPLTYGVYGDLGIDNGVSIPLLKSDVDNKKIDIITHIGDFAYDMHDDQGEKGDRFMRAMGEFTNQVPYMVSPGNHEVAYNFSHYTQRFDGMPFEQSGSPSNWYYSYDAGLVHWVSISTEVYFGSAQTFMEQQYNWLINDLKKANMNRDKVPWIILVGHRMMYCSCDPSRVDEASVIREGVNGKFGLEEVAQEFGVDLFIAGHNHNYERSYPVYKGKVEEQDLNVFKNPSSLVHIVAGAAGGPEEHRPFAKVIGKFSAYHSLKYGYGRLTVHNATHLYWEEVVDDDASVEDHMWLIQESHGPHTGSKAVHDIAQGLSLFRTYGMDGPAQVVPGRCPKVEVVSGKGLCMTTMNIDEKECMVISCDDSSLPGKLTAGPNSGGVWL